MDPGRSLAASARRIALIVASLLFSVLSCGREITGPEDGVGTAYARGFAFETRFTDRITQFAQVSAGVVEFNRVRVLLQYRDGRVALDRIVDFPTGASSVEQGFDVPLSADAPASGEELTLTIAYITAAGDTIFRAGPLAVLLTPSDAGDPPPTPIAVTAEYVGVGANATDVVISPDTITIVAGDPFTFTAVARDASATPIAGTPIAFLSLDATRAAISAPAAGAGTTLPPRGYARVVAQLMTEPADTAVLHILPRFGSLVAVAGQGVTRAGGTDVSVTVRSIATDGLPMSDVPITMAVANGGGSLSTASATTDANGDAGFTWTLGAVEGSQSVTVSGSGVPNLVINANSTFAGATQLVITQHPGATHVAGETVTPAIVVEARTAANELHADFTGSITLSLGNNPNGASLIGTVQASAVAGIATISGWEVQRAGTGYTIVASAGGLAPGTSTPFDVTPAAAVSLVLESGGGQVAEPGAALVQPIVARVNDAYGNGVAGHVVNFAVAAGSLSQATATTDANGFASTTWTLGTAGGQHAMTVTSAAVTGTPLQVTATAAGAIVATVVGPQVYTMTSIGATMGVTAESRDASQNLVPTTYTWATRNPAIATVNTAGFVTAVANGATYVVATAAGGTRDSTLVTVNQVLATIVVTPGTRDIYLGAAHAFTAQAVDGLGVPLGAQPSFTWSSQAGAIASVSASGLATGVGLGSTQVRATSGLVTGVATLNVRTPIMRIAVVRDSATFVTTDTFSLAALNAPRSYRAVAYDTLDAVIDTINFAWVSSNPSVAQLDSTGTRTARARSRANGFTSVRATAQGVTGGAALNVQQVMTAIDLALSAATIAPTGNSVANPRRLDANGFALPPGGAFTFQSADAGIATVSAGGVVTGVATGATAITAMSGAITSNQATITVSNSVPPVISFGRDTLSIGRSATNQAVPIYLSRPHTGDVTVSLGLVDGDTIAFFNPALITIPQGSTVGTASLNGRNAQTSAVFAIDGGTSGYAGDTAVLVVQATVAFQSTSYNLITNDQLTTQVRLSDPSPAGGTFVTYTFGTPGRVSISPDPAFIPEGQLSASVVIRATAAGGTSMTPAATGVNGTASSVNTTPATLTAAYPSRRLGAGQFDQNLYVYTQSNLFSPLGVTFTPTDSARVQRAPVDGTIPAGLNYVYYDVVGVTPGTGSVVATAPGFTSAQTDVVVTTPKAGICCGGTYVSTSPDITVTVYAMDSVSGGHNRVNSLNVQLRSSDPSVLQVLTPEVTIAPGIYYNQSGRVRPVAGGTAWVHSEASGHTPDSVLYTVIGPKLEFSWGTTRMGAGQYQLNQYVYVPHNLAAPLTVTFTRSDAGVLGAPASVTIPAGTNYVYFNPTGLTPGVSTLIATAPGYQGDTATVTATTPRIRLSNEGQTTTYQNFTVPQVVTVYSVDSVNNTHYRSTPLEVTYTSSDENVVTVTAVDMIQAGIYYSQTARVTVVGPGTATVTATAVGHGTSVATYTIAEPQIQFSNPTYRIGRRQHRLSSGDLYVYIPSTRGVPVPVTLTQTRPDVDSLSSTSLTIPGTLSYAYFGVAGLGTGADTVIVSAPGYRPDTMVLTVTTPRLLASGLSNGTTTSPRATVFVYAADSVGTQHYSLDTLWVSQVSGNVGVIQPDSAQFHIRPGHYFGQTHIRYVGPGSASMSYDDSLATGYAGPVTTNTITVTGPSLGFHNGRPILGMRQNGAGTSAYVTIPNAIASNLVVNLVSTDPAVASVPASVTIVAGQTFAYVPIRAEDQVGTVQVQATATGYTGAAVSQEVTAPRFLISTSATLATTAPPAVVTVQVADANGTAHYANEDVAVTLVSSNGAAGTIDSTVVVVQADNYFNNRARFLPGAPGTTTITASDARTESYRYEPGTFNVAITTPPLSFSMGGTLSLGIGQYLEPYVSTPNSIPSLDVTLTHSSGASATPASLTITNTYFSYFRITGAAAGTDLLGAVATGHTGAAATVTVGLGRVDPLGSWPATIRAVATDSVLVTLYTRAPNGEPRNVAVATTFDIAANGNLQAVSGGANSVAVTQVTVPANGQFVQFYVKGVTPGNGTLAFTNANYQPYVTPAVVVNP
jgi:hypothetical protein